MAYRHVTLPGSASRLLHLLGCCVLLPLGCAGSEAQQVDSDAGRGPGAVRPVLVLPSPMMLDLASVTETPVGLNPGRRDRNLGGTPLSTAGPGVSITEVRDDQRVVNGRVQSQTRWRTRSGDIRGRLR